MRALITGITGFAGSHLAELLLDRHAEVFGTTRWRGSLENVMHFRDSVSLIESDIRDAHSVRQLIDKCQPDFIFHLAAQTFVPTSFHAPQETMTTNVVGAINLLEAVRLSNTNPVVHLAGSSEEYGFVHPDELPIRETNLLRPLSPYGVSKAAVSMLGSQYHKAYSMRIIVTRAFNHTGPRRGDVFATSNFAKQIAEIEKKSKKPVLHAGNLAAQRDFLDVRDVVKAYVLAVERCKFGEIYNICSEQSRTIESVLHILLRLSKERHIQIVNDASRLRPSDVQILLGDCSKFKNETGWEPEIPFEKTLEDLLTYWREKTS